ncbi:alpha/beta fold hydrolase [Mycobacterium intracellulare]|uniref:alpha/beta fold hydrolase n=1 Tax=Mycobacterium intracellulare TaxID=1767 RepID=UPI001F3ABDDD|nr:alpha/beta hydrolase [Mycobacterium intracellulare]
MTDVSEDELAQLPEFALLHENAEQAGVSGPLPDVERVESGTGEGKISALRWGGAAPRIVFIHGGGQNAHTWDTVIVGLGEPALAVDLPGHGHSAWREDGDYSPRLNADTLLPLLRQHAPSADLVVGMSLGGLTAIRLGAVAPELVKELVLIDVTPSALQRHSEMTKEQQGTVALMHGEREFPSFQAMLDLTIAAPRGVPQLPQARQRQLDVALRRHPHLPRLLRPVGRRRRVVRTRDARARWQFGLRQRR